MRRVLLSLLLCAGLVTALAPAAWATGPGALPAPRTLSAAQGDAAARDDAEGPVDYVALGDSYAAGVGTEPDGRSGDCLRSDRSYPARWAAAEDPATFVSVACSGATTGEVLFRQVRAVSRETDLVTITAGGNDTGFSTILGICSVAREDEDCTRAITGGERIARYVVPVGLTAIIGAAKVQSPRARVVVLGYPRLFADGPDCDVPLVPNAARRAALNRAADTLNRSLRDTATRFGATFADVAARFDGHAVCDAGSWINPPTDPPGAGSYHPTPRGYTRGYLPALTSAVDRA